MRRLALLLVALVFLAQAGSASAEGPLDVQAREIARQLQCPVCQGVSVADSSSELATQMKALIRKKLEDGESPQTIIRYFTDRYGEGILIEPPKRGLTLLVWLVPVVGLLAGAGIVYRFLRRRTEVSQEVEPAGAPDPELARYRSRFERELAGSDQGSSAIHRTAARLEGEGNR